MNKYIFRFSACVYLPMAAIMLFMCLRQLPAQERTTSATAPSLTANQTWLGQNIFSNVVTPGTMSASNAVFTNGLTVHGVPFTQMAPVSIVYYGAKGGTNDDSAAFVAAEATGQPVYIPNYTNWTFTNLTVTHNGFAIIGDNSVLSMSSNSFGGTGDGTFIQVNSGSFIMSGIIMDGQYVYMQSAGNQRAWGFTAQSNTVQNVLGERSGLTIPSKGASLAVINCRAINFSGRGFRMYGGTTGILSPPNIPHTTFLCDSATNNWIGLELTNGAEYCNIIGFDSHYNGNGIWCYDGNQTIVSWVSCDDSTGFYFPTGGANPNSIMVQGSTINHDNTPFQVSGVGSGLEFINCHILACSVCGFVTNISGFRVIGGMFEPTTSPGISIIIDGTGGGGTNWIRDTFSRGDPGSFITSNGGKLIATNNFTY